MSKATLPTIRKGRPRKTDDQQRTHKVTISFTDSEYEHLRTLAGHEVVVKSSSTTQKTTARPRRQHGSMAGHIRTMIDSARQPLTGEQFAILNKLVAECNTLDGLARRAETTGLLALSVSLTTLQQRISRVLDEVDRSQIRLGKASKHA